MEIIQICPQCDFPALEVNEEAVKYNLINSKKDLVVPTSKWSICINPECDCSYFSKTYIFKISDLDIKLFFKDTSNETPICYCSNLTRGEIHDAVKNGCKSIDDVQDFTNKNVTGYCEERNPLGKCCRNVFLKTIAEASK